LARLYIHVAAPAQADTKQLPLSTATEINSSTTCFEEIHPPKAGQALLALQTLRSP